jgi:ribonuclease HI
MDKYFVGQQRSILSYFAAEAKAATGAATTTTAVQAVAVAKPKVVVPTTASIFPTAACGGSGVTATAVKSINPILIFCDGACANNGKKYAKAGFGMSAQQDGVELIAISEPLGAEEPQTNQRAELRGLQAALTYVSNSTASGVLQIHSDSQYAINSITKWAPAWKRAGWRKADSKPVLHRDLIEPMYEMWKSLTGRVTLMHVDAHTGKQDVLSKGNARADELATASIS